MPLSRCRVRDDDDVMMLLLMIVPRSKCLCYSPMPSARPHSGVLSQRITTVYEEIIMALRQERHLLVLSLGTSPVLVVFRSTVSDMAYTSG
jgi:hypothetical protein